MTNEPNKPKGATKNYWSTASVAPLVEKTIDGYQRHLVEEGKKESTAKLESALVRQPIELMSSWDDPRTMEEFFHSLAVKNRRKFRYRWKKFRGWAAEEHGIDNIVPTPAKGRTKDWDSHYKMPLEVFEAVATLHEEAGIPLEALAAASVSAWKVPQPDAKQAVDANVPVLDAPLARGPVPGGLKSRVPQRFELATERTREAHRKILEWGGADEPHRPYIPVAPSSKIGASPQLLEEMYRRFEALRGDET
jgi:hypothetical protein